MNVNPVNILSILSNVRKINKTNKYVDLDSGVNMFRWNKTQGFVRTKCTDIWNDMQNSLYSISDYKLYLLHKILLDGKIELEKINATEIKKVVDVYTPSQFIIDKQTILEVSKEVKLNDINDYFSINEDGESLIYKLIINKHVNPIFYMKMKKYLEGLDYENENLEHRKFRFMIKILSVEIGIE